MFIKKSGSANAGGNMKIAIVTGASSGMGREFVKQISENYKCLDEIWVIGRNADKLCDVA